MTSWPIQGHSCDMHSPLSLEMLLSFTWQILAPYTINHSLLCGFVAALGFGFSLPASQIMKRMNIQTLIVELSWAAFTDIRVVTKWSFSCWNSAKSLLGSKWLHCLFLSVSRVSQLRTTATHWLFYFEDLFYTAWVQLSTLPLISHENLGKLIYHFLSLFPYLSNGKIIAPTSLDCCADWMG